MKLLFALLFSLIFALPSGFAQQVSKLKVSDSIVLRISGVPADDVAAISSQYTIGEDGKIPLAHIGRITASGLTPSQLGVRIEQAYKEAEIFTNPTLAVTSADKIAAVGRLITVMGEVKAAQQTPYRDGMTIMDAVAAAGGFTDWGDARRVRLVRGNNTTEHDFSQITKNPRLNVSLQPDDKIVVIHR